VIPRHKPDYKHSQIVHNENSLTMTTHLRNHENWAISMSLETRGKSMKTFMTCRFTLREVFPNEWKTMTFQCWEARFALPIFEQESPNCLNNRTESSRYRPKNRDSSNLPLNERTFFMRKFNGIPFFFIDFRLCIENALRRNRCGKCGLSKAIAMNSSWLVLFAWFLYGSLCS
jgi:hypothetical protein